MEREKARGRMGKKVLTPVRKYRLYFFTSSLASAGVNFVKRPFPSPRVARKIPLTRARALGLSGSLSLSLSLFATRAFAILFLRPSGCPDAHREKIQARVSHPGFWRITNAPIFPGVSVRPAAFSLLSFFFLFFTPVSPNFDLLFLFVSLPATRRLMNALFTCSSVLIESLSSACSRNESLVEQIFSIYVCTSGWIVCALTGEARSLFRGIN